MKRKCVRIRRRPRHLPVVEERRMRPVAIGDLTLGPLSAGFRRMPTLEAVETQPLRR